MNWTTLYQKIFFRVDRSDQKIVDGVIVTEPDLTGQTGSDSTDSSGSDQTDQTESDLPVAEPKYYPIAIPDYQPMYIVDSNSGGDLGLFYHWLQTNGYKSLKSYMGNIKVWRDRIQGHLDTTEILRVISGFGVTYGKQLIYSLKVYGQYRHDHGDPRISVMLAVDERKLRLPSPKREKFDKWLSPGAIEMMNDKAKALCTEGDRAGIWLGLLLRGVPSSAVETVEIKDKHYIRFKNWTAYREARIPQWLMLSMTERIKPEVWRRNRVTVKNRIKKYENPMVLYKNAEAAIKILGE